MLVDLNLPGMDGLEVLEQLRSRGAVVIVLTGDGDVPTAVRAMQAGAENFLVKPVDLAHLLAAAQRAVEKVRLRRVNRTLIGQSAASEGIDSLGTSQQMQELAREMTLLALSDRNTMLLLGESGTGKRWIARLIHDASARATEPFIELACGSGDSTWLEAELFGRAGANESGAVHDKRKGLLDVADGGTLFLDEVADLPLEIQAKILSVLETHAFRRVGGDREIPVDVRIVAATARSLPAAVEAGRFREDLFARLSVVPLTVPPLRNEAATTSSHSSGASSRT